MAFETSICTTFAPVRPRDWEFVCQSRSSCFRRSGRSRNDQYIRVVLAEPFSISFQESQLHPLSHSQHYSRSLSPTSSRSSWFLPRSTHSQSPSPRLLARFVLLTAFYSVVANTLLQSRSTDQLEEALTSVAFPSQSIIKQQPQGGQRRQRTDQSPMKPKLSS